MTITALLAHFERPVAGLNSLPCQTILRLFIFALWSCVSLSYALIGLIRLNNEQRIEGKHHESEEVNQCRACLRKAICRAIIAHAIFQWEVSCDRSLLVRFLSVQEGAGFSPMIDVLLCRSLTVSITFIEMLSRTYRSSVNMPSNIRS